MEIKAYFSEWEAQHELPDGTAISACITYPVTITDEHATSSYGLPVVVIDGQAHGAGEMPAGELQLDTRGAQVFGPSLTDAGYQWQELYDWRDASLGKPVRGLGGYWTNARKRPVVDHWHPQARYVIY